MNAFGIAHHVGRRKDVPDGSRRRHAKYFHALIEAKGTLTAVLDRGQHAAGEAKHGDSGIVVACGADGPIDEDRSEREDPFRRLVDDKP